jgi:hypothetical protein
VDNDEWVVLDEFWMTAYVPASLSEQEALQERERIVTQIVDVIRSYEPVTGRLRIELEGDRLA